MGMTRTVLELHTIPLGPMKKHGAQDFESRSLKLCDPLSKLLVSPLITPIVVPYIIPYIAHVVSPHSVTTENVAKSHRG